MDTKWPGIWNSPLLEKGQNAQPAYASIVMLDLNNYLAYLLPLPYMLDCIRRFFEWINRVNNIVK